MSHLAMTRKLWPLVILLTGSLAVLSASPQPGQHGLSMIVVPTEEAASELRNRIRSGASFEALAIAHSTDSTSARAGYMGMVDEFSLRPEFRLALEGLKPGSVSPVARVGDAFVLLKWTTTDEDRWRSQNDAAQSALQRGGYLEAASLFLEAVRLAETLGKEDVRLAESLNG